MYFLQQIKRQFIAQIMNYVGPEGQNEAEAPTEPLEGQSAPVGPEEVGDKARSVNSNLDTAIDTEEGRGLLNNGEETLSGAEKVLSNFSVSDADLSSIQTEYPDETDVEVLKQRVLENKLEAYHNGELPDEDREMIENIFADAGLDNIPMEISIDALESGEIDNLGEDMSPEELAASGDEVGEQIENIDAEIASLPNGPEREVLERRRGLLGGILDIIEGNTQQGGVGGMGFAGVESNGSHNVVGTARAHLGIHERSGQADKFLMGMARSARETPWCAGFVSYVCKEAGYNINPTLSSKAFIGETGKGHVGFNIGGGQMLGGNQSDSVTIKSINKPVSGWIMPEDYAAGKPAQKSGNAPVGAIIVFNRGSSERNVA